MNMIFAPSRAVHEQTYAAVAMVEFRLAMKASKVLASILPVVGNVT